MPPVRAVRIGEIPYLNSLPFYWDKRAEGAESWAWVPAAPRGLGGLARSGKIDAGPLSLVDALALADAFEPLGEPSGDLGIAVRGAARSVLLFSRTDLPGLDGRAVGVTPDTATSFELLRVILEKREGISPLYRPGFDPSDHARLLIGDEALRAAQDRGLLCEFPVVLDLGEEWRRWQGLPFVFARWMVRKSLDAEDKRLLSRILERNLRAGLPAAAASRPEGLLGEERVPEYLGAFRYRLGEPERRAIAAFKVLKDALAAAAC